MSDPTRQEGHDAPIEERHGVPRTPLHDRLLPLGIGHAAHPPPHRPPGKHHPPIERDSKLNLLRRACALTLTAVRSYAQYCPVARTSEVLAERWTPIIIRNLLAGCRTVGGTSYLGWVEDLILNTDSAALAHWHLRHLTYDDAVRSGALRVEGSRQALRAFLRRLRASPYAATQPALATAHHGPAR